MANLASSKRVASVVEERGRKDNSYEAGERNTLGTFPGPEELLAHLRRAKMTWTLDLRETPPLRARR